MTSHRNQTPEYRQQGVVLAITLLILLVVTVVGITTMSSSSLQMLLARNTQLKQISFQNAESTVLNGELTWDGTVDACLADPTCTTDITPPMISDIESFLKGTDARLMDVSAYNGKYVVEYLGWRAVSGDDERIHMYYRISDRALGPADKAVTQIQTIYRKCMKKDGSPCPT
jgi:type IV pilus assembly protein PilX